MLASEKNDFGGHTFLGQFTQKQKKKSVTVYSPLDSKPVYVSFFCETQKWIFWEMFSFNTLQNVLQEKENILFWGGQNCPLKMAKYYSLQYV